MGSEMCIRDRYGAGGYRGATVGSQHYDFEDIKDVWSFFDNIGNIGDIFSGFGGGREGTRGGTRRRPSANKGQDYLAVVNIPFELAVKGGKIPVEYMREEVCDVCQGSGVAPGSTTRTCDLCNGRGVISQSKGFFAFQRPCPRCGGTGKIITKPCPKCKGRGRINAKRKLRINIPAGIQDGGRVRVRGEGGMGTGGAPRGDLIVQVKVMPHTQFKRIGDYDLEKKVKVNIAQAILGCELNVTTIDGKRVKVKVPAGTQPGTRLRLKGLGIQTKNGKGDLYVVVDVEVPRNLTSEQKELIHEFARKRRMDV